MEIALETLKPSMKFNHLDTNYTKKICIYDPQSKSEREKYTYLRSAGAILLVRVPATIIQSDCLGLGLKMTPKRSRS